MLWLWTREAGPAGIGLCLAVPQPGHTRGTAPAFHIWFDLAVFIKKQTVVFFLLHSPQLYSKQLPPVQLPVTSLHTKGAPQRNWEVLQESGVAGPVGARGMDAAGCAKHRELGCGAMVWGDFCRDGVIHLKCIAQPWRCPRRKMQS